MRCPFVPTVILVLGFAILVLSSGTASAGYYGGTTSTVMGGWAFPVGAPLDDSWNSGFATAVSFRRTFRPNITSGVELAYSWHSLDEEALESQVPGLDVAGGDLGLFAVASNWDFLLAPPEKRWRPFVSGGLGFYASFVDDISVRGPTSGSFVPNLDDMFFGVHAGAGLLYRRGNQGLQLDIAYRQLFRSGDDIQYVPVRLGFVFFPLP